MERYDVPFETHRDPAHYCLHVSKQTPTCTVEDGNISKDRLRSEIANIRPVTWTWSELALSQRMYHVTRTPIMEPRVIRVSGWQQSD
jgi:hypothetical protein